MRKPPYLHIWIVFVWIFPKWIANKPYNLVSRHTNLNFVKSCLAESLRKHSVYLRIPPAIILAMKSSPIYNIQQKHYDSSRNTPHKYLSCIHFDSSFSLLFFRQDLQD